MKFLLLVVVSNNFLVGLLAMNDTMPPTKALYKDLFITKGYTPLQGPNHNHTAVPNIWLGLYLVTIDYLDEAKETLKTMAFLDISWYDDFLVWNPDDYDNMTFHPWYQDYVWKPQISLTNSVTKVLDLGTSQTLIENYNTGFMYWHPLELLRSSCKLDLAYFPFDKQRCELNFGSISMGNRIMLEPEKEDIDMSYYTTNANWEIVSTSVEKKGSTYLDKSIFFVLELRRKPSHALLTLLLPIILLSVLTVFVFALPSDGGEKAGYSITVFLACSVYLTIVQSSLPANSGSLSYFSIYLAFQTVQSTVISILALIFIRMASFDDKEPLPKLLCRIIQLSRCCISRKRTCKVNAENTISKIQLGNRTKGDTAYSEMEDAPGEHENIDADTIVAHDKMYTWKTAATVLDKIAFVCFASLFVLSTSLLFIVLVNGL